MRSLALSLPFVALAMASCAHQERSGRDALPMTLPPFEGRIGTTYEDSQAAWQSPVSAPAGAPNVIVILLDDVGFGHTTPGMAF